MTTRLFDHFAVAPLPPADHATPAAAARALELATAHGGLTGFVETLPRSGRHVACVILEPTEHGWADHFRGRGVIVLLRRHPDAPTRVPWEPTVSADARSTQAEVA